MKQKNTFFFFFLQFLCFFLEKELATPLQYSCLENPMDGGTISPWGHEESDTTEQMLEIWSLVPLPFLNPAYTSGSSRFMYCWSLAWRILSIILLACEMKAIVQESEHSLALSFLGIAMKADLSQSCGHCWIFHICWHIAEKAIATHSSTLAWKIPWTEKPGRLQSMGLGRVRHDWATSLSLFTFMHWRRKWQPIPVFLPGESQGWGSLVGCRLWDRTESDSTEAT